MSEPLQRAERLVQLGGHWGWVLTYGVLTLIVGILVLAWPGATLLVIAVLFGVHLIIEGIFRFGAAFAVDEAGGGTRLLLALLGVLSVAIGLWAVRHALLTLLALVVLLGIFWVVNGTIEVFTALSHQRMTHRGWTAAMGGLSILAGIVVLIYPAESLLTLSLVLGIWLLVYGAMEAVAAFRLRGLGRPVSRPVATAPAR